MAKSVYEDINLIDLEAAGLYQLLMLNDIVNTIGHCISLKTAYQDIS